MDYVGLESVSFGSEDLKQSRQFFTDWGLQKISQGRDSLTFQVGNESRVLVRSAHSPKLAPQLHPNSQFRSFELGVKRQKDLEALASDLSKDRAVHEDTEGRVHFQDDAGIHVSLSVSKRLHVKAPKGIARNEPGRRARIDLISPVYAQATPWQMGHIVFFVPDTKESETFYIKRLGFWLSDRYVGGAGVFLRWAQRSEHHNLFLIKSPHGKAMLHHIAFEVKDQHEVFGGGLAFSNKGWATEVGPGRHPISSAYFWYFKNPHGGSIEYFCDPDYVTEQWKPHQYRVNRFSEWHLPDGIQQVDDGKKRPSLAVAVEIEKNRTHPSTETM